MSDFEMSGSDLEQMYQEVILEAAKNPHGKEHFAPDLASENASHAAETTVQASHEYCTPGESHQFNPTCGDEATIHAKSPMPSHTPSNGSYGTATDAPSPKPACPSWSISSKAKPWTRP